MAESAYIYCADIYCEECGEKIKADLDAKGQRPANPNDERTFDSDEYPKGPYDNGGGEADTPQHCGNCHKPLLNDLTDEGVKYVLEYLKEYVEHEGGTDNNSVLDGWAEQLHAYSLTKEQEFVVTAFKALRKAEKLALIPIRAKDLLPDEVAIGGQFRDGGMRLTVIQRVGDGVHKAERSKLDCITVMNLQDQNAVGPLMVDNEVYRFPRYGGVSEDLGGPKQS